MRDWNSLFCALTAAGACLADALRGRSPGMLGQILQLS